MITCYAFVDGRISKSAIAAGAPLPPGTVWADLLEPTREEEKSIEKVLGLELPTREEMQEIEDSSRLYQEGDAIFLTAPLLYQADSDNPGTTAVTFIQTPSAMVTVRYASPKSFQTFSNRIERQPLQCSNSDAALLGLLEAVVDRMADVLERIGGDLEGVSKLVFSYPENGKIRARDDEDPLREAVRGIGRSGNLVSRASDSLLGLTRLVSFLSQATEGIARKDARLRIKTLARDIRSLSEHAFYLSNKVTFLLDAAVGMINIEQNNIIKIFSVAATVFLPPTLIASIYGMNFRHIPELDWTFGYPFAIVLMIASAIAPYLYFKRRGWL
ncbi:MAG: magnesium transporter [Alphaproteobacteria bacterium]|nr:magnesium transporter [Alphaproteobacteria bacterium]